MHTWIMITMIINVIGDERVGEHNLLSFLIDSFNTDL